MTRKVNRYPLIVGVGAGVLTALLRKAAAGKQGRKDAKNAQGFFCEFCGHSFALFALKKSRHVFGSR